MKENLKPLFLKHSVFSRVMYMPLNKLGPLPWGHPLRSFEWQNRNENLSSFAQWVEARESSQNEYGKFCIVNQTCAQWDGVEQIQIILLN
jgi:hypothetical protein